MFYRPKTGMIAWMLFRLTGLALVFYLSMHIFIVSSLQNPDGFNKAMGFLGSWQFRFLEIGLFAVVIYHSMNGVRILIIDFFDGALYHVKLFWTMAAIGFVFFLLGVYPIITHALYWKENPKTAQHQSSLISTEADAQIAMIAGGNDE